MQEFIDGIMSWLNSGSYGFFTDLTAYMIKQSVKTYIAFLIEVIPFAWGVANEIIDDLNISQHLNSAWGSLDSDTRAIAGALKIPEGVNFLLSSAVTRFVLRFIPGF